MAQIVIDPALLESVEYDIWKCEGEWVCVASRLPFLGEISGHGEDAPTALKECQVALHAAVDSFNH